MEYGYVFRLGENAFGILAYTGDGPRVFIRFTHANTINGACKELSSIFAGNFRAADDDQEQWGRTIFKGVGSAQLLTN